MVDRLWIVNLRTMQRQLRLSSVPEPGEFGRWSIDLPDKRDGKWAVPHRLAVCDGWDCGWNAFFADSPDGLSCNFIQIYSIQPKFAAELLGLWKPKDLWPQ